MKLAFHGAARMVTGSKHLLTLEDDTRILLDCGMFQGCGSDTDSLNKDFRFDPAEIDIVVLSHAHIDHTGLLPKLVREGFSGKVYCTSATRDLSLILLEDSAKIQQNTSTSDCEENQAEAYFELADVVELAKRFAIAEYNQPVTISDGVELLFTDAGHIIGSAAVHLSFKDDGKPVTLTFSGDIGRSRDAILCAPCSFPQADYIIMESTYGSTLHDSLFNTTDELLKIIRHTCLKKGGNLIIPAFSVGRTQEILYYLNQLSLEKRLQDIPVIIDSPLSFAATQIVKRHREYFNARIKRVLEIDDDPFDFPNLHWTKTVEDSIKIKELKEPAIIIAASGMADAGRIRHHIADNIGDSKNTILIVGYCSPASLGGKLARGDKEVTLLGNECEVLAEVHSMRSMSAHGDYNDLSNFLSCQDPEKVKKIFLVHGEYEVQKELIKKLVTKGFEQVYTPDLHEEFTLRA
ncbi:MAG: MBL fold metallo-hydrolase [Gemmatimonadaceae bacterium]|nr:MBL fold metallo-hydrolase [Chitinophagaceae bacterium]